MLTQYTLWVDENESDDEAEEEFIETAFYGQLLDIFHCTIAPSLDLETQEPITLLLAHVQPCPTPAGDATREALFYSESAFKRSTTTIINAARLKGAIGRVAVDNKWGIVDRQDVELARPQFEYDDQEHVREV